MFGPPTEVGGLEVLEPVLVGGQHTRHRAVADTLSVEPSRLLQVKLSQQRASIIQGAEQAASQRGVDGEDRESRGADEVRHESSMRPVWSGVKRRVGGPGDSCGVILASSVVGPDIAKPGVTRMVVSRRSEYRYTSTGCKRCSR